MDTYNIIVSPGEGEFEDRKSRFIGHVFPISSEAEAQMLIEQIKRKYWDARHNCYAYITGERGDIQRFSDDGEPGGTAGRPILEVLTGNDLRSTLIVVTRYFGGTLLGTGGLVRAYTKASQAALDNAVIGQMQYGSHIAVNTSYNDVGRLQYFFAEQNIKVTDTVYTENVLFKILIPYTSVNDIIDRLTQTTNGKAEISVIDTDFFVF